MKLPFSPIRINLLGFSSPPFKLLESLRKANQTNKIGFDISLTIAKIYGKQEKVKVDYNPNKRGKPSYSTKAAPMHNKKKAKKIIFLKKLYV